MPDWRLSDMAPNKITKTRGKMVKPILKKLSHSPKNSLDLDRGWDEQPVEQLENGGHDGGFTPTARDVSFGFLGGYGAAGDASVVSSGGSGFRAKFQHGRSGSQASAGSGPRGAFVHPFAQTPRTATPPLSYANSLVSLDNGRDCSPTITENEDDDEFDTTTAYSHSPHHHHHLHHPSAPPPPPPAISSQSNLRRPSLNSQRTNSFPEIPSSSKPPSLRINTSRSVSGATSRLAHSTGTSGSTAPNASHSDLHLNNSLGLSVSGGGGNALDSPTGSLGGASISQQPPQQQAAQMSPLRSSLDMSFPRLRSRSELDTALRAENIRAARRKFEERERVKEEKYDREMIRKRERRDTKEASRIEKGESARPSAHRRITPTGLGGTHSPLPHAGGGVGIGIGIGIGIGGGGGKVFQKAGSWASGRNSPRPEVSGRSSPFSAGGGASGGAGSGSSSAPAGMGGHHGHGLGIGRRRHTDSPTPGEMTGEKHMGFASRKYESVPLQTPPAFGPGVDDVRFEQARPRRGSGAKRKTQSYWQGFILWLRTKLLRLGAH